MCLWPAFCWRLVAVISSGFWAVQTEFHSLLPECWVFLRPSALCTPYIYRRDISISMHKLFAWDIFPHACSYHSQMTGHRLYSMHEPPKHTHTHIGLLKANNRCPAQRRSAHRNYKFCVSRENPGWFSKVARHSQDLIRVFCYSQPPETKSVFTPCP